MRIARVRPMRRALHVVGDLVLAAWTLLWAMIAWTLKSTIDLLAQPAVGIGRTTEALAGRVDDAARQIGDVPVVGSDLATPFGPIANTLRTITSEVMGQVDAVHATAWLIFWVIWLMPTATLALIYLPPRIRRARESAAARSYIDEQADLDLFALRAIAKAPMTDLAAISDDPLGALRDHDTATINKLADLELKRVGIGVVEKEG